MLLERGLIEQQDLQIALAHKMGVALVDISRFPIDRSLVAGLPQDVLRECHALPLLRIGQRLVVAIDDLARLAQLQHHRALTGLQVEPALALRKELAPLLAQHIGPGRKDPWAANVPFLR
jgi:type IV pilus assembly protein PilB